MYQDLVDRFNSGRHTKLKSVRFRAILNCLSAQDACHVTLQMLNTDHDDYMSDALSRKLAADITHGGWQQCHDALCRKLLEAFSDLGKWDKRQHAYVLGRIAGLEPTPQALKVEILPLLLASPDKTTRTYAYEALQTVSVLDFIHDIEAAWQRHGDNDCARLIVKRCPTALQERQFTSLWATKREVVTTPLLLHVELLPERLATLRQANGITYAYICAKRGLTISDEEASELWDEYANDEKAGLLLWCFGQMKLLSFLTELQLHRTRHSISPREPVVLHGG